MSQFDSLLDFGDSGTTGESGATETNGNTAAQSGDDFDPFGPSVTMETKGGGDGNLLVDFTADAEVSSSQQQQQQNGLIDDSDPFGISAEVTTSSSSDKAPSNNDLLFDMSAGANPLYEYSTKTETQEEDDGLVTTTVTTTTSSSSATASANPLYDFLENGGEAQAQEESLLDISQPVAASSQNGVPAETAAEPEDVEEPLMQEPETELIIREDEPAVEMEPAREPSPEPAPEPAQAEPQEEPEEEPDRVEEPEMEPEPEPEPAPEPETLRIVESGDEEPAPKEEHKEIEVDEPDMVESAGLKEEAMMRDFEERDMMRSPSCSSEEAMATKGQEPGAALASGDMVRSASGEQYGGGGSLVTGAEFVNSSYRTEPEENGTDEIPRDPNIVRETREKEEIHFSELSSVKNRFEAGQAEEAPRHAVDVREEYTRVEGGEYENTPVQRTDVAREADRNIGAELPEIGTAKNLKAKFANYQSEQPARRSYREPTPPDSAAGGEYVSEPRGHVEKYEGKAEAGVFENVPVTPTDVVRSGETVQEELPEHGYAKNVAARFKQLEKQPQAYSSPGKRELTPDRTGRSEYVSEPRATMETYEGKAESGVFENVPTSEDGVVRSGEQAPDVLPERGVAKNLTAKWRQMESGASGPPPSPGGKRAITPDRSGRSEYVSEPRAHIEHYEGKAEAGVFESTPQGRADVVRSEDHLDEPLPEHGLAKNLAARFRELETQAKSPPSSAGRTKEITPPREAGVYESQPQVAAEVARGDQQVEEILPQKGTARSMASRFLQIAEENKSPPSPTRGVKEFTPPRNHAGQAEVDAGVRESQPQHRPDVLRESDPVNYEQELPERGAAKNVLSKFRQLESESAKQQSSSGGRVKEFTPPREEPRVLAARSPKTPSGGLANAGHVHPSELPGQYQPQVGESVFESEPQHRPDVVREADTDWEEGLPAKNTTRSMVDRFRTIQAETSKEQAEPVSRKTRKSFVAVQTEKCGTCQKTVYAMERLEMNKCVYHKNCFRCSHCKAMLTPKTFAVNNGTIFCTAHYKQLFARKGNYDEGFGREQHKQRWRSEANGTEEGADS